MKEAPKMGDLAAANVNRSYQLAATSVAIFTFSMAFLYPRYLSGDANAVLFQVTLVAMGVAPFSFVFAALYYYGSSLADRFDEVDRARYSSLADRLWLLGLLVLFLVPSLILVTVELYVPAVAWFALWVAYVVVAARYFPRIRTTSHE
jgi:hypothetical protein